MNMDIDKTGNLGGEFSRIATDAGRGIKGWISRVLTAMKLPAPLVNVLTWTILLSLGLLVLMVVAVAAFALFMLSQAGKESPKEAHSSEEEGFSFWVGNEKSYDDFYFRDKNIGLDYGLDYGPDYSPDINKP